MLKLRSPTTLTVPPGILAYAKALETDARQRLQARMGVATLHIFYWLPDHPLLLQTYVRQLDDDLDFLACSLKFIHFWQRKIDGRLHEVEIDTSGQHRGFGTADYFAAAH